MAEDLVVAVQVAETTEDNSDTSKELNNIQQRPRPRDGSKITLICYNQKDRSIESSREAG